MFQKAGLTAVLLAAGFGMMLSTAGYAADSVDYTSLKDFCQKTKVDTPENCACGQATADRLLSNEEQTMALNMMSQQSQPEFQSMEAQADFMARLRQVTDGCNEGGE